MDNPGASLIPAEYQTAIAVVPKITGSLSMMGSAWILYEVLSDKHKRQSTYHRILLGLSVSDFNKSFWAYLLSSWMMPNSGEYVFFYGSVGNLTTCNLQGFMFQLGLATPLYNSALSLYYLLLLKYRWTPLQMAHRMEPYLHGTIILVSLTLAIVPLLLDLYNPTVVSWCTITEYPPRCGGRSNMWNMDSNSDCTRGRSMSFATLLQWICLFIPVWLVIIFVTVTMFLVYQSVKKQELVMESRYKFHGLSQQQDRIRQPKNQRESERILMVCILYTTSFYATFGCYTILNIIGMGKVLDSASPKAVFAIIMCNNILLPLQGVFNCGIYLYPRYQRYREQKLRLQAQTSEHAQSETELPIVSSKKTQTSVSLFGWDWKLIQQTFKRGLQVVDQPDDDDYKLGCEVSVTSSNLSAAGNAPPEASHSSFMMGRDILLNSHGLAMSGLNTSDASVVDHVNTKREAIEKQNKDQDVKLVSVEMGDVEKDGVT